MDTRENTNAVAAGATVLRTLIDAMDFLGEAKAFNEAAYMACEGLPKSSRGALQQVLKTNADVLQFALDRLEAVQVDIQTVGAA